MLDRRSRLVLVPAFCLVLSLVLAAPALARQAESPFALPSRPDLVVPPIGDDTLDALMAALDAAVPDPATEPGPVPRLDGLQSTFWNFGRRLQSVRLTADQEGRVLDRLDAIGARNPGIASILDAPARMVRGLTIGKTAPEIVGRDLDGVEFRLSDYRGKVVVVVFSADWCAICRSLHPYERLMAELYETWPFAILGVDGSGSPNQAAKSKAAEGLTFRSWWDEPTEAAPDGRISAEWNARGRPTVYVLDGEGVIRFVDLRHEDLLKAVRQVLTEHMETLDRLRSGAGPGH